MPFDEVAERISAKAVPDPCSIRLKRRSSGKPACLVTLRKALMEEIGWTTGGQVSLLVGTGDDVGKIRLKRAKKAPFLLRILKFSGQIDLGYIEAFGEQPKLGAGAKAKKIDADTIEVTLPKWAEVENEPEGTADEVEEEADPSAAVAGRNLLRHRSRSRRDLRRPR